MAGDSLSLSFQSWFRKTRLVCLTTCELVTGFRLPPERITGIEPVTYTLARCRAAAAPHPHDAWFFPRRGLMRHGITTVIRKSPSPKPDSNRRPDPYHGPALPLELSGHVLRWAAGNRTPNLTDQSRALCHVELTPRAAYRLRTDGLSLTRGSLCLLS